MLTMQSKVIMAIQLVWLVIIGILGVVWFLLFFRVEPLIYEISVNF